MQVFTGVSGGGDIRYSKCYTYHPRKSLHGYNYGMVVTISGEKKYIQAKFLKLVYIGRIMWSSLR